MKKNHRETNLERPSVVKIKNETCERICKQHHHSRNPPKIPSKPPTPNPKFITHLFREIAHPFPNKFPTPSSCNHSSHTEPAPRKQRAYPRTQSPYLTCAFPPEARSVPKILHRSIIALSGDFITLALLRVKALLGSQSQRLNFIPHRNHQAPSTHSLQAPLISHPPPQKLDLHENPSHGLIIPPPPSSSTTCVTQTSRIKTA